MYFAAVLDDNSKRELQKFNFDSFTGITKHGHHVTLIPPPEFKKNDPRLKFEGKPVEFKVDAIGNWKNGVFALRVDPRDPLVRLRKKGVAHITLATKKGFAPKDSNEIRHWSLIKPLTLKATLQVVK